MPADRLPPLNAIRAFEAAARLGSYVAASQALHVTQPAVGRHVKNLESWLGVQLFNRTPRGVTLTAAGRQYYQAVSKALGILCDAGSQVARRKEDRWLRILCVPAFASRWLTPHIDSLRSLRPDLKLAIEPNASFTCVDARQADLGIAYGLPAEHSGVHTRMIRPQVFPVCSPAYLATLQHKRLAATDLASCALIHVDDGTWWNSWFAALNIALRVKSNASHMSNDIALNLARLGHGIALATDVLVQHELAEGLLVRCSDASVALETYQVLTPQQAVSEDVAWFIEWLNTTLREEFPLAALDRR